MKRLLVMLVAVVLALAVTAFAGDKAKKDKKGGEARTIAGFVSDSGCGANGAKDGHEACAKKCIDGGKEVVFVDAAEKKVWKVENPESLKGHEGHRVNVKAHVNAESGSIHVAEVSMPSGN
jgi:hypothetical protein